MGLLETLLAGIQYLLPQHLLSRLVYGFMRIRVKFIKNLQISLIAELVGVDWSECKLQKNSDFEDFNAFFTRELADNARPPDPDPQSFVSPSDGRMSQCGRITGDRIVQAKGHHYSLWSLLAHDPSAREFNNGFFHTIYLSPRDYHRVHMPLAGKLQKMIHVPGRLFSVAPYTVRKVPNLFARNERVISLFETAHGPMAVILVGAMLVSSMQTVWSGSCDSTAWQESHHGRLVTARHQPGPGPGNGSFQHGLHRHFAAPGRGCRQAGRFRPQRECHHGSEAGPPDLTVGARHAGLRPRVRILCTPTNPVGARHAGLRPRVRFLLYADQPCRSPPCGRILSNSDRSYIITSRTGDRRFVRQATPAAVRSNPVWRWHPWWGCRSWLPGLPARVCCDPFPAWR